jgi:hypothetical protein
MMIFGMMYFDQTHKLAEEELIEAARQAFERRTNSKATIALLDLGTDAIPEIDGLEIYPSYLVRPHHTIVGVPATESLPENWLSQ